MKFLLASSSINLKSKYKLHEYVVEILDVGLFISMQALGKIFGKILIFAKKFIILGNKFIGALTYFT